MSQLRHLKESPQDIGKVVSGVRLGGEMEGKGEKGCHL